MTKPKFNVFHCTCTDDTQEFVKLPSKVTIEYAIHGVIHRLKQKGKVPTSYAPCEYAFGGGHPKYVVLEDKREDVLVLTH